MTIQENYATILTLEHPLGGKMILYITLIDICVICAVIAAGMFGPAVWLDKYLNKHPDHILNKKLF